MKTSRNPKCARCRNHGLIVPQKGHVRKCQFVECRCWKCALITQRTKIMSIQRKIKKSHREELAFSDAHTASARPSVNVGEAAPAVYGASMAQEEGAQLQRTSGMQSNVPGAREVTVIKMPTRRFEEADGKTYTELEDVPNDITFPSGGANDPLGHLFDHRRRQPQGQASHDGSVEYRDETRFSNQDGRGPFFVPHPAMRPVSYQEELVLRQHPLPPPPKAREHAAAVVQGSQGSEVNSMETDTSSQEAL
ncbi:uncharacterized protein FYW47_016649 [Aplochiton taeniatus]